MNNSEQPLSEQISKPPDRLHDTAGVMLRKARESANLTQATVGEALHLTVHYIKALENDDYSKLPGATFVKGYLRVYARYLKLDANAVLASYERNNVSAEELSNRTQLSSRNQKRHDQTFKWAIVTAIIVVLGIAAGWWFVGKDQAGSAAISTTPPPPAQQPAQQPVAVPATASFNRSSVNQFASAPAAVPGAAAQDAAGSFTPASGTTAATDTTVVNAAASLAANTAISTDGVAADDASTVAEITQTPATTGAVGSPATNNQTVPGAAATMAALLDQNAIALTTTNSAEGGRHMTLTSAGTDMLQLNLKGASWVEIEDDANGRLYNDSLNSGDAITLRGTAPFKLLLGDATQVELSFNSVPIDLSSQIRSDKTARFLIDVTDPSSNIATSTQSVNP